MHPSQPTGIFIPADKKGIFKVTFEKVLLDSYNIIIVFENVKTENSCQVKFEFKKELHQLYLRQWYYQNAKKFLLENLYLITTSGNNKSKRATPSTSASLKQTDPVSLENCGSAPSLRRLSLRSSSTIDLTSDSFQSYEPEVIDLEDCLNQTTKSRKSNKIIDIIDLDDTAISLASNNTESDIQIIGIKSIKPQEIKPKNEVTVIKNVFIQKNDLSKLRRSKRKSNSFIETPRQNKVKNVSTSKKKLRSSNSKLTETPKSIGSEPKRKKRKLCDVPSASSKTGSQKKTKPLSDGVLKYYTDISKAINKGRKSRSPKKKNLTNKVLSNKKSNLSPSIKKLKSNTPNRPRRLYIPSSTNQRLPGIHERQTATVAKYMDNRQSKYRTCDHESNIFNPNPNVDIEGLRPVAIDGSNVAIGHGKGIFSTKGLKICVDYFVNQGHKTVKVFLPLHRQNSFSKVLLEELKNKCDMVFTPSRVINGRRTTSYDDRFIVQYAVEFGAVVVSTDNFRDLLEENPRWTKVIQERLLMFTWIDDFLMFPMDPLGKNGPTLDEFLKF